MLSSVVSNKFSKTFAFRTWFLSKFYSTSKRNNVQNITCFQIQCSYQTNLLSSDNSCYQRPNYLSTSSQKIVWEVVVKQGYFSTLSGLLVQEHICCLENSVLISNAALFSRGSMAILWEQKNVGNLVRVFTVRWPFITL